MTCIPITRIYKLISRPISSCLRPSTPILEPILPQELIDAIIDELGSNIASYLEKHPIESQALQNCALVSRSFHSRATRWLFFRTSFNGKWNDETWIHKRVEGFLRILIANPSIGESVRELVIETTQNDAKFWLRNNAPLVSILGQLSRIHTFNLVFGMKPINWGKLPSKTATALRCTIQSPSIRFLDLRDIHEFPWYILDGCRTLKDLEIFRVHATDPRFPSHSAPSNVPPMLESLYIISAYSTAEYLASNPITARMFARLRTLSVGFHRSTEIEYAVKFILRIAQTLETLNIIDVNDQAIYGEGPLDFSKLPVLRQLKILRCIVGYHPMGTPQFPSSLCRLLKLQGSTSYIQTIVVHIDYEDVEAGTEEGLFLPNHGWAGFDAILADENYRSLKKVTLNIGIQLTSWDPSELRSSHEVTERIKRLVDKIFLAVNASGRVALDVVINRFVEDDTAH